MDIAKFSTDALSAELKRREEIRDSLWPKVMTVAMEMADEEKPSMFLQNECGFGELSNENHTSLSTLDSLSLSVLINSDGSISIPAQDSDGNLVNNETQVDGQDNTDKAFEEALE